MYSSKRNINESDWRKIQDRYDDLNSYGNKAEFNDAVERYNNIVRGIGSSWTGDNERTVSGKAGIEVLGLRSVVSDMTRELALYNWTSEEKMFEFKAHGSEEQDPNLVDYGKDVQRMVDRYDNGFSVALEQSCRDWLELGMGFVVMFKIAKNKFKFLSLPPQTVAVGFDHYQNSNEFICKYSRGNTAYMYHYEKSETGTWGYKVYYRDENKRPVRHYLLEDRSGLKYQPIYCIRDLSLNGRNIPWGKGLSLMKLIVRLNNMYESLTDTAACKLGKAIIMSKGLGAISKYGSDERFDAATCDMQIYTIDQKADLGERLFHVLDNSTEPALAQWLYQIGANLVQQTFSINRLLSNNPKEMTATEVKTRDSYDRRYINVSTQPIRSDFLEKMIFSLVAEMGGEERGINVKNFEENYRIVWNDTNTRNVVNQRLQEISAATNIIGQLSQLGAALKQSGSTLDLQPVIDEVSRLTDFEAAQTGDSQATASSLLQTLSRAIK